MAVSKQEVGYQGEPRGTAECDDCSMFRPPNGCSYVQGVISPHGWCRAYVNATEGQSAPPD